MFAWCAKCWSFVEDELLMSGFDWKSSSIHSACWSAVAFFATTGHMSAVMKSLLVAAVFFCSMFACAALTVYRFRQWCRQEKNGDPAGLPRPHRRPSPALDFLRELFLFLKVRKKFWLLPIIVVMLVFGGLIILAQGSAVAPFIYTIF